MELDNLKHPFQPNHSMILSTRGEKFLGYPGDSSVTSQQNGTVVRTRAQNEVLALAACSAAGGCAPSAPAPKVMMFLFPTSSLPQYLQ